MSGWRCSVLWLPLICAVLAYDGYTYGARLLIWPAPAIQTGTASWYGREEQGKPTASGETFDRHKLTAAHRRLPFNTVVRVTNRANGRSVLVRINDRGPYKRGRILDLSEAAADTLDMKKAGVTPVSIELVSPKPTAP